MSDPEHAYRAQHKFVLAAKKTMVKLQLKAERDFVPTFVRIFAYFGR